MKHVKELNRLVLQQIHADCYKLLQSDIKHVNELESLIIEEKTKLKEAFLKDAEIRDTEFIRQHVYKLKNFRSLLFKASVSCKLRKVKIKELNRMLSRY